MVTLMWNWSNKRCFTVKSRPNSLILKANAQAVIAFEIYNRSTNQMFFVQHALHGITSLIKLPRIMVEQLYSRF